MDWIRTNGVSVIVTALATGIVTILSTLTLSAIQNRSPSLIYTTIESIPFADGIEYTGIYHVVINNDGKKEVENVTTNIRLHEANITSFQIQSALGITYSDSLLPNQLDLFFPLLNPTEEVRISLLASSLDSLPQKPEVALRARGVTGKLRSPQDDSSFQFSKVIPSLLGAFTGIGFMYFMLRTRLGLSKLHRSDQRKILAYICSLNEKHDEAEYYYTHAHEVHYWSESDRLTNKAINSREYDSAISILQSLINYAALKRASKAIVLSNLARLEARKDDKKSAKEYLKQALKISKRRIKPRIALDPILKSIHENE